MSDTLSDEVLGDGVAARRISFEEFEAQGAKGLFRAGVPTVVMLPSSVQGLGRRGVVERLGDMTVTLFTEVSDRHDPRRWSTRDIVLHEFFADDRYLGQEGTWNRIVSNIRENPEAVEAAIGFDPRQVLGFGRGLYAANLWISHRSVFTKSHFDEFENFNIALDGRKRFVICPPGYRDYYPRSLLRGYGDKSSVFDFDDVDVKKWPRLAPKLAERRVVVLEPGEMLYLPMGWWHQAESLDAVNINVNFWMSSSKIFRMPYVLGVFAYGMAYRKAKGIYHYQPAQESK